MGESLEKLSGSSLGDSGSAVDDEVGLPSGFKVTRCAKAGDSSTALGAVRQERHQLKLAANAQADVDGSRRTRSRAPHPAAVPASPSINTPLSIKCVLARSGRT